MAAPDIRVPGVGSIPSGYFLGRFGAGFGPVQLIDPATAAGIIGTSQPAGAASASGISQLTGDVTAGPGVGSVAATLATVNSNVGSFTAADITVNAKGLVTAAANGSGGGGGSGALTLVSTATASSSATLDFTGLAGTTWKLVGRLLLPATAAACRLRFGTGAGPTYVTAGYNFGGVYSAITNTATVQGSRVTNSSEWELLSAIQTTSPGISFNIDIITDNATFVTLIGHILFKSTDDHHYQYSVGGSVATSAALTALSFYHNAVNTATGTLSLYELAE